MAHESPKQCLECVFASCVMSDTLRQKLIQYLPKGSRIFVHVALAGCHCLGDPLNWWRVPFRFRLKPTKLECQLKKDTPTGNHQLAHWLCCRMLVVAWNCARFGPALPLRAVKPLPVQMRSGSSNTRRLLSCASFKRPQREAVSRRAE